MPGLRTWLRKRLNVQRSRSPATKSRDALPVLRSPRRSITPENFAPTTCRFFELPWEIRRTILVLAFGGRTLHIDLHRREGDEAWQWRGLVCGRPGSGWSQTPRHPSDGNSLFLDWCLQGGNDPTDPIGVMGFLLACKQAYVEGIDVLYTSNRITMQSVALLLHLPLLMPKNRLASITVLDIIIDALWNHEPNTTSRPDLSQLAPVLASITTSCSGIRSFTLTFESTDISGESAAVLSDANALPLLDAFYRGIRKRNVLRDMVVELPYPAYQALHYTYSDNHSLDTSGLGVLSGTRWRCLDGEQPMNQWRMAGRYPEPPLRVPVREGVGNKEESQGYWFKLGPEGEQPLQFFTCL